MALLFGGRSGEHEISVRSANSVRSALDPHKYEVLDRFITKDGRWEPEAILPEPGANEGIDVVFPILHGTFGEDGTVQGLFELAGLPYVGEGVLVSAAAMDKPFTKQLCRAAGLPVVPSLVWQCGVSSDGAPSLPFGYPVFVKPANLGSSVGISKVKSPGDLAAAIAYAAKFDGRVIIEKGIEGREFECAVLGGSEPRASVPCEILPSEEFYTYDDKYVLDKARIELPPKLTEPETKEMQRLALAAFAALGCEAIARVDFLMDRASGQFYINEVNTMPGFTSISMYPKMWAYSGIAYGALLDRLIELALERAQVRGQLQYSRS